MVKNKEFDYKNKILDYGFLKTLQSSGVAFETILNDVKENLIIVDTNGDVLTQLLPALSEFLKQEEKVLIGVVDEKTLLSLRDKGINNGFFRSTDEKFHTALIIRDKSMVAVALDKDHIYEVSGGEQKKEIFDFVNHVIWSKALHEKCQNNMSTVKETRLSVIMPSFSQSVQPVESAYYQTTDASKTKEFALLKTEEDLKTPAKVMVKFVNAFGKGESSNLYVNLFRDCYYPIGTNSSIFKAVSFENRNLGSLIGKDIWYKGKETKVFDFDELNVSVVVPLDQVDSYMPDFEEEASKYKNLTAALSVNVDVQPIVLDNSYTPSKKYGIIAKAESQIKEGLDRLEKLVDDDKKALKQIESIRSERNLGLKIKLYNKFVGENDLGLEALNNKKSSFPSINVNEDDLIVPNALIGRLFIKGNDVFLATTSEKLSDAKAWLKETKTEAVLIKNNG